jgi:hypothetical protein
MNKLLAVIQLITSALVSIMALATLINLIFISTRPETISVVNTLVGQGVLIIILLVLATVLFKKGLAGLKQVKLIVSPEVVNVASVTAVTAVTVSVSSSTAAAPNAVKPIQVEEDTAP